MATNNYNSLTTWLDDSIHLSDVTINNFGNNIRLHIKGDRWRHKRLGYAYAPGSTVAQDVEMAAIEAPVVNATAGDSAIAVKNTKQFSDNDYVYLEDDDGNEIRIIDTIQDNESLTFSSVLANSYDIQKNFLVSSIPDITLEKNADFTEGDFVSFHKKSGDETPIVAQIIKDADIPGETLAGVDNTDPDKTIIRVKKLGRSYKKDDMVYTVNTSTKWTRDPDNPILGLQSENYYHWGGKNISSGEIIRDTDIKTDDDDKVVWKKPGLFFGGDRAEGSGQIGLAFSEKEDDFYNWSTFLGNENQKRLNPIIRHSYEMDTFDDYADTAALNKIWNTEDADVTVTLNSGGGHGSTNCMDITYERDAGEVYGLMPVPVNFEVRSDETTGANYNYFQFKIKGDGTNVQGDVKVTLLAADGTSTSSTFGDVLQLGSFTDKTFDFSSFAGRRYIRAVIFEIIPDSSVSGTDTILIDRVKPFLPPRWDEIMEDPTVISGEMESGEGVQAMYYTARERPRQTLTSNSNLAGATYGNVAVTSTTDFIAGDIVVLYDWDGYEIGEVENVIDATNLSVKHHAYDEDNTATFINNYSASKMATVANNTYRVNKIGGAYKLIDAESDTSNWEKWTTDSNPTEILEPSTTGGDWDDLSVGQPSCKILGNDVYMAYVGQSTTSLPSIGFAKSSNYTTFTKLSGNPFVEAGVGDDASGCLHPDLHIDMPYTNLHYTGYDGTNKAVQSAIHVNSFHNAYTKMHVSLLVYPCASFGVPPSDGCVLFDMGNFWVEVGEENRLRTHAYIDGKWHSTEPEKNLDMNNAYGTSLVNDHWNLIVAQFSGGELGMHRVSMMPRLGGDAQQYFTRSPWMLAAAVTANATSINVTRQYDWVDAPSDFSNVGQDIMLWGKGLGTDYQLVTSYQVGRVVNVTAVGGDLYTLDLANPIGPWGFSNVNTKPAAAGATYQGVLLAQGFSFDHTWDTNQQGAYWTQMFALSASQDTNHMFEGELPETYDSVVSVSGGEPEILDPSLAMPPMVGNGYGLRLQNQDKKSAWIYGYFGHIDIGLDILDPHPITLYDEHQQEIGSTGGRIETYASMINQGTITSPRPQWHLFDLQGIGQLPTMNNALAYWDLEGGYVAADSKFTDDANNNDLYLQGSATTIADGYMGRTIKMTNATIDAAECELWTSDFTKQNSGNTQFDVDSGEWDGVDVESPHLFRAVNNFNLLYTGKGRVDFQASGDIIGDVYETGSSPVGITLSGSFYVYDGTTVTVYASWQKRPTWHEVWTTDSAGTQTMPSTWVNLPGSTTDYFYAIKWKIELQSDPTFAYSPIVNNFSCEYTDPGGVPSARFMTAQNALNSTPIYQIELVPSSGASVDTRIDIKSYVKSIMDLSNETPVKPDQLGGIIASDVTIEVHNTDLKFSENNSGSYFYNRDYLEDEIRIYSGFTLATGDEYYVVGRFLIDYIEVRSDATASIYCRSLLREAMDTIVGNPVKNASNPLVYKGPWKVKQIMLDLLTNSDNANIDAVNCFIEDADKEFSNISIDNESIGSALSKLAQACDGVVYTNNQGDIHFKTWGNMTAHAIATGVTLTSATSTARLRFTGQRRDRLVKKAIVRGIDFVQAESSEGTYGRIIDIQNDYIQKNSDAQTIANNIYSRYNTSQSELEIDAAYLPSIKMLDTVRVTETLSGLSESYYLVNSISKNITEFRDKLKLTSNLEQH